MAASFCFHVASSISNLLRFFQELEEAEIEMDLLQKEKAQQEVSRSYQDETPVPSNVSCKYL